MLKSCCDCLFGYSPVQAENEIVHGIELSGHSILAPPWPQRRDNREMTFILPKQLGYKDVITIKGTLSHARRQFSINLLVGEDSSNFDNVACTILATFPHAESDQNTLEIIIIKDGIEIFRKNSDYSPSDIFTDGEFKISIICENNVLDIYSDDKIPIEQIQMQHKLSDVRFLTVNGDFTKVNQLSFDFS